MSHFQPSFFSLFLSICDFHTYVCRGKHCAFSMVEIKYVPIFFPTSIWRLFNSFHLALYDRASRLIINSHCNSYALLSRHEQVFDIFTWFYFFFFFFVQYMHSIYSRYKLTFVPKQKQLSLPIFFRRMLLFECVCAMNPIQFLVKTKDSFFCCNYSRLRVWCILCSWKLCSYECFT